MTIVDHVLSQSHLMPPPRKAIVKSGNAGNSSKNNQSEGVTTEKSLFPPGSKWPSSLLHERQVIVVLCRPSGWGVYRSYLLFRCKKNGWEKPRIDTRKIADQFAFVVTLYSINPKTSQTESVRLEPHTPYTRPTPIEARHWGATYALYRVSPFLAASDVTSPNLFFSSAMAFS